MTTQERVHHIIRHEIGFENEITDETTWNDMGMDSLDRVELVIAFEEDFAIDIPDEEADRWEMVGEAIAYLVTLEEPT